jgi:hypothetical protein
MTDLQAERAAVRAQILSDQAQRAAGETHTARTVELAARRASALWARMSADQQRQILGGAVFGRREARHRPGRGFEVRRVVGFGGDHDVQAWSYAEIAALLNQGETVAGKKD